MMSGYMHTVSKTRPPLAEIPKLPTGAKIVNKSERVKQENIITKYPVASCRIVSKMLGIPGYLGFLAVIKMIKNANVSTVNSTYSICITNKE